MTADPLASMAGELVPEHVHLTEGGYLAAGSPGRMAALTLLSKHPQGVPSSEIRAAIRAADPRVFDEHRLKTVLQHLRRAGLADTERDEAGLRWFSPGARKAAALRAGWRPATTTTAPTA